METSDSKPKPPKPRRRIPFWARIGMGVVLAALTLLATGVALRYWITSDGGRGFIVSQIDGKKIGPLGTIRISGLKGDPLTAATLGDIALVDDDGIWLRAKDARIEWTPEKLFGGELEIRAIQIRTVDVLRTPHVMPDNDKTPPPDIGLKLDDVLIDELHLAETLVQPNATYRLAGGAARGRNGSGFAKLAVTPLSGPTDRIDITSEWSAESLKGHAVVSGPPGGLVALLVQSPNGKAVMLEGAIDGNLTNFKGSLHLVFDSDPIADIDITRSGDAAKLTADIAAAKWPLLDVITNRAGDSLKLSAETSLAKTANAPTTLHIIAPAGEIDVAGSADFDDLRFVGRPTVTATGLDLALLAPPLTGKVDVTGDLDVKPPFDFELKGNATAANITWPAGAASRVVTPITVGKAGMSIYWEAPGATIEGGRITPLNSLAPARYTASSRGEINLRTHIVDLIQAQVRGAPGDASARGTYTITTGAFDYSGSSSFNRLADLAPLIGSARGQWTAKRASHDAPIRITADASGRDVSSSIPMLAELAGPTPNVKLSGVIRDGRFTLESGAVKGDGITATMNGRISDAGAIAAHATGSLTRAIDLPGARVRTLEFTADLSGGLSAPRADIRLSNGALEVAGLDLDNIGGDAALKLGDKIAGNFSLFGASGKEPLIAAGRIESDKTGWRLAGVTGRLGGVQLSASQLAYANGIFSANFDVSGPLAGLAGLDRGALAAKGTLTSGDDKLKLDASGQLTDLRSGTLRVDLVSFKAKADNDTASLETHIKATRGAPFDITLAANARHANQEWTGDATLDGTVDQQKVSTSRPAAWRYGANGWSLDTQLAGLGGTLDAKLADLTTGASVKLDLTNVNLKQLSQLARITQLNGTITGSATFTNGPGPAVGEARLVLDKANPIGVKADPVSVTIESHLLNGVLNTSATGSGQGFKLDAASELHMLVGHGLNLTADRTAPVMAHVTLDGRAEQLWAVFGPEGQALRGEVTADVSVAGTLSKPTLTGGFGMDKGAYEHGETGLHLVDISAKGQFDQRSASITDLIAHDPQGGELSGGGAITWDNDVSGKISVKATNLRALGRDDRSAIVSGDGAVTLDKDAIHVAGAFEVSQARISIEQPSSATIPSLTGIRRINFRNQDDEPPPVADTPPWLRPIQLDLKVTAPRRVVVFGRGLDTEWSANFTVQGPIVNPTLRGTATLVRGSIDLAGRRFDFDTGTIDLDGPIKDARIDISAKRTTTDIDASIHVTGTPAEPKFELVSTPSLPQDEILARVLFGRSASQLSAFEAAQLAAGLAQLAGGQAGFDPAGLVRKATGLDRVALGGEGGIASVSAGKYVSDNVYVQVGAGGEGGAGASVEWEPKQNLSVTSSAQANGDTKLSVRWKKDY